MVHKNFRQKASTRPPYFGCCSISLGTFVFAISSPFAFLLYHRLPNPKLEPLWLCEPPVKVRYLLFSRFSDLSHTIN